MRRATPHYAPAAVVLAFAALVGMGGCAHFRNAEVRADHQRTVPVAAAANPLPDVAAPDVPFPAAAPTSSAIAPPAPTPMPVPVASASAPPPALASAPPPAAEQPPAVPPPIPATSAAVGAATDNAIIIFANNPGVACANCDTLKISVTPSGQVLIERGDWGGGNRNWRYKREVVHVAASRAAAFAASLRSDRPKGQRLRGDSVLCVGAATETDGLVIEWVEAERRDMLTVQYGCPAGRNSPVAERLRHAPDLLGLRGLFWP